MAGGKRGSKEASSQMMMVLLHHLKEFYLLPVSSERGLQARKWLEKAL